MDFLFAVCSLAERAMLVSAAKDRTVSMKFMLINKSRSNGECMTIAGCTKSGTWIWIDRIFNKKNVEDGCIRHIRYLILDISLQQDGMVERNFYKWVEDVVFRHC